MKENVLNMHVLLFYLFTFLLLVKCDLRLKISEYGIAQPLNSTIELTAGINFYLVCMIEGYGKFSEPQIRWGRKTKELKFRNETDLLNLAKQHSKPLLDLQNSSEFINYYFYDHYESNNVVRSFTPVKLTDRGTHFCMSLKYLLFKIIHIKVKDGYLDTGKPITECNANKFQCVSNGFCINMHYKCDGRHDCKDGSDEDWDMCNGDPCWDKIRCRDGRCIPEAWCCDKHTDENCNVTIRPDCCPPLQSSYDPMMWYPPGNITGPETKSTGSKYLFITICVVTALLSFVLFLFVISKICGFDTKPPDRSMTPSNCDHSECVLRRQFSADVMCLYRRDANVINTNDNNNDLADPLIILVTGGDSDQPPSYSEVINTPSMMDKSTLDLLSIPPPPYSSTKYGKMDINTSNQSQTCDTSNA